MHLLEASISREDSSRLLFLAPSQSWSLLTLISSYPDIVLAGELPTNSLASCRVHMCRRVSEQGYTLGRYMACNKRIWTAVGADLSRPSPIHRPRWIFRYPRFNSQL